MTINSSQVAAGDIITAAERNKIRKDILIHAGDALNDVGSANAYDVVCDDQITALEAGMIVKFIADNSNTGASTLRFRNSLSLDETDSIKRLDGGALLAGDIVPGPVVCMFDGTDWNLLSPHGSYPFRAFGATAGEDITVSGNPVPIYFSDGTGGRTAGRFYRSDANDSSNEARHFDGYLISSATTGNVGTIARGLIGGFSGLTPSAFVYVQDSVGTIGHTQGSAEICAGKAVSSSQVDTENMPTGMQFISEVNASGTSDGSTITAPAIARFAFIKVYTPETSAWKEGVHDVFLAKFGKSTSLIQEIGNVNAEAAVSLSWSGTTITLTSTLDGASAAMAGTAVGYFFR